MFVSSAGIFLSRLSGLGRDILFAKFWGTGNGLGAFFIAFTIPNLFRRVLGEGALSDAFVPTFLEKLGKNGEIQAYKLASNVITVIGLILLAVIAIGIGICVLIRPLFPSPFVQLTIFIVPFLLPYTFFICLTGLLAGILNSLNHFAAPVLNPIILNILFIIAVLFICPMFGSNENNRLFGLAIAVIVAGFLQLTVTYSILVKLGFEFTFLPDFKSKEFRDLVRLVIPGIFGASINQINVLFDRLFAGWLGGYAVTSLYYSERIIYLPIGIFGVALATSSLPVFSKAVSNKKIEGLISALSYSLRHILYLTIPCACIIILLSEPLVALIYQRGSFNLESCKNTMLALIYYAPGIPAFAAVKILRNGFYSQKNTITPVRIGCFCLCLNLALNALLIIPMKHAGLALATTLCAFMNVILLVFFLSINLKSYKIPYGEIGTSIAKILICTIGSCFAIWISKENLSAEFQNRFSMKITNFFIPAVVGCGTYLGMSLLLKTKEPIEMYTNLTTRLSAKRVNS